jgi:hypothetical protein
MTNGEPHRRLPTSARLDALGRTLSQLHGLIGQGLASVYGYDGVAVRATADGRHARDPSVSFFQHSLWNPPKARPTAHARLAGVQMDRAFSSTWQDAQRLLADLVVAVDAQLARIGLDRCAVATVSCEANGRMQALWFGFHLCDPRMDGDMAPTLHVVPDTTSHPAWKRLVQRLDALDSIGPIPDDAPVWRVVVDHGPVGFFAATKRSPPYRAATAEQAFALCAALDWPELFHPQPASVAQVVLDPGG